MSILVAEQVAAKFGQTWALHPTTLEVQAGEFLAVVGPNGSGKSTLLKILSGKLVPEQGSVLLAGKNMKELSGKQRARSLALLHQSQPVPADLTVEDLVWYGRYPYQRFWRGKSAEDRKIVDWAMKRTSLTDLAKRLVATLSGGERQRVWIAMALAQQPRVLLLDEPTTFLDMCHQLEVMELLTHLNRSQGLTLVLVLHDMNHAARYAHRMAVLQQGRLYSVGTPAKIVTPHMLAEVFRIQAKIWSEQGHPVCLPQGLLKKREKSNGWL